MSDYRDLVVMNGYSALANTLRHCYIERKLPKWSDIHDAADAIDHFITVSGDQTPSRVAELLRLKNRFDTIFNNVLCDMKPGWDDSIEGFNKAWDIARDIFQEEIGRATASALTSHQENTP